MCLSKCISIDILLSKLYDNSLILVWIAESVSRPQVWLDGSPAGTCRGQPVLLRCRTEKGSNVNYSWFREAQPQEVLLESSADLLLHCAFLSEDAQYACSAQNAVSREQSKPISIHILQAGQENCIYSLTSDGQLVT